MKFPLLTALLMIIPAAFLLGAFTGAVGIYFYIWIAFPALEGCLIGLWTGYVMSQPGMSSGKNARLIICFFAAICAYLGTLYVEYTVFPDELRHLLMKQEGFAQSVMVFEKPENLARMVLEREAGGADFLSYLVYRFQVGVTLKRTGGAPLVLGVKGATVLFLLEFFFMYGMAFWVSSIFATGR